jgi:hypothetical protein
MTHPTHRQNGPEDGDLTRLLAAEQRLETLLAEARAEAARTLAEADAAASAAERGLDAELERGGAAVEARVTGERARREAEIVAVADAAVARYDGLAATRVDALADRIVAQLLVTP